MGIVYSIFNFYPFSKHATQTFDSDLFELVSKNDYKTLEKIIESGVDVSTRNNSGLTLLHTAAELGHEKCIHALLKHNAIDVNCRDSSETPIGQFQTTPLHLAASEGWPTIVSVLIENGADVNAANIAGWTPLHYMIINEQITAQNMHSLMVLIDSGADVNRRDLNGNLPLETAILYGHCEVTRILLNSGVDMESVQSVDPNLLERDDVYQCIYLCVSAGCYRVIDKYELIKYIIQSSDNDSSGSIELLIDRIDTLLTYKSSVQSLKHLCRLAIRKCLRSYRISELVYYLELPHFLQSYLLFEQY